MSKLVVEMSLDDAACQDPREVQRILNKAATEVASMNALSVGYGFNLYDINGIKVGKLSVKRTVTRKSK